MTTPHRRGGTHLKRLSAALALLLVVVTGCTGGEGDDAGGAGNDTGSREIFVASGRDVTGKGGIRQQLIEAWNKEQRAQDPSNPYRAHLVELSGTADQQRSQLLGALQSGSAEYDVVNLDVTWVPEFAEAGLIGTLGKKLDDDVIESVRSTAMWDGKVYSQPFNSDVGLLFYRRDYLEKADVKTAELDKVTSWKGIQKAINDVEDHPPNAQYKAGWTTQLDRYEGRTVNAIEAFESVPGGVRLTDDKGRYTAPQLGTAVSELSDRVDEAYTLRHAYTSDETESLADFAAGQTAFLRHWPYAYETLSQTFTDQQLGVMPLPGNAVLGGQNLAVTKSSSPGSGRGKKARELIDYLTQPGSERCLLDAGFAATRISAYRDAKIGCLVGRVAGSPSPGTRSGSGESGDRTPRDSSGRPKYASGTLLTAIQHAVQRPRTPYYGAFTQAFTTALDPLFDDKSPDNSLLTAELDRALRKALPTAD